MIFNNNKAEKRVLEIAERIEFLYSESNDEFETNFKTCSAKTSTEFKERVADSSDVVTLVAMDIYKNGVRDYKRHYRYNLPDESVYFSVTNQDNKTALFDIE
jgi:hypothetical protein